MRKFLSSFFIIMAVIFMTGGVSIPVYAGGIDVNSLPSPSGHGEGREAFNRRVEPEEYLQWDDVYDIEFGYTASFDRVDYSTITLSFLNHEESLFYSVPFENFRDDSDVETKLPAGTYTLEYVYYNDYPNLNYETKITPETFIVTDHGIYDTDGNGQDFIIASTRIIMKTEYLNDLCMEVDVMGEDAFSGEVTVHMEGDTDLEKSTHEIYDMKISDVYSNDISIQMKAGRYRITGVDVRSEDGETWKACYNGAYFNIVHHQATFGKIALYKVVSELTDEYVAKVLDDVYAWEVTDQGDMEYIMRYGGEGESKGVSQAENLESVESQDSETIVLMQDVTEEQVDGVFPKDAKEHPGNTIFMILPFMLVIADAIVVLVLVLYFKRNK